MRYLVLVPLLTLLALSGCRGGPGKECNDAAEASAIAPPGGQAAAAAASGGQQAGQAPFSGEAGARIQPRTVLSRGQGNASSTSADRENRETASGGAQNLGLLVPATATASNNGGVGLAVQEAAKTVAAARTAFTVAAVNPDTSVAKLEMLAAQVVAAQASLNAASASSRANVKTVYHMGGDNVLIGVSTSASGGNDDEAKKIKDLAAVAAAVGTSESSAVPADDPGLPPAGDGE